MADTKPIRRGSNVKDVGRRRGGKQDINPWDAAKELPVIRGNWMYEPADLEPGVKFFVLMLEQLGCEPVFSCEGHPGGFYVTFRGTEAVARAVASCRFFDVRVVDYRDSAEPEFASITDAWRLSPWGGDLSSRWSDFPEEKATHFQRAADSWVKTFGPLAEPTKGVSSHG